MSDPRWSGLAVWNNGVQLFVADDDAIHVAVICNEGDAPPSLYLNGKCIYDGTLHQRPADYGRLEDAEVIDHALTSAEVVEHYNAALSTEPEYPATPSSGVGVRGETK